MILQAPLLLLVLTVRWLGEVLAGLLWFEVFLLLARVFVGYFHGAASTVGWTLRAMTDPVVRPFRRLLGSLRVRPSATVEALVAALALYLLQVAVWRGSYHLYLVLGGPLFPPAPSPFLLPIRIVRLVLWAYVFLVLLRVLVAWFASPVDHPLVRFLRRSVDPALRQVRLLVPPRAAGVDLSPVILLGSLWFLDRVVLEGLAYLL